MQARENMNEFLNLAANHLMSNKDAFLAKLDKGDIAAIKMVFDFINKNSPKSASKNTNTDNDKVNIKDMNYDEAFELIKDNIAEAISEEDTD